MLLIVAPASSLRIPILFLESMEYLMRFLYMEMYFGDAMFYGSGAENIASAVVADVVRKKESEPQCYDLCGRVIS